MTRAWGSLALLMSLAAAPPPTAAADTSLRYEDLLPRPSDLITQTPWGAEETTPGPPVSTAQSRSAPGEPGAKPDPRWTDFRIQALQRERRSLRIGRPAAVIALSTLGFGAGTWLLAIGIEGPRGPRGDCTEPEFFSCVSRPAPYAGTVLMGVSVLGLVRGGMELRARAQQRRRINGQLAELSSR